MSIDKIKAAIRDVPDFPVEGIIFKDIMPVLEDAELFKATIDLFVERYKDQGITKVAGIDARGFLFASAIAYQIGAGVVTIRKKGKLPYKTIEESYELEYGSNTLAMHMDAVEKGEKVLLIDDLLATGGTALASAKLLKQLGADIVEVAFLIELGFLGAREKMAALNVYAPIVY